MGTGNSVMAWVVGIDHPDLVAAGLGEPEVAVGPGRDAVRVMLKAVGTGNSVMA